MFYPADWRKDPELRVCSIAARGLWIDMIALMHEGDPYGHLVVNGVAVSAVQLARLVGEPVAVVRRLLAELESHNVFSRNEIGVAFSRRMVADEHIRNVRAEAGKLGGNPTLMDKGKVKPLVKQRLKQKPTPSVAVAVSPSEGLAADAEPKGLDLLPKAVCDMGYEAFTKRLGAVNYGRFRKEILPIYQSRSADHPSGEELVQAVEAFVEARDADRPNFRTKYTVTLFASALHEYVRLGKMPLVNEWGEATERGRACGIGV